MSSKFLLITILGCLAVWAASCTPGPQYDTPEYDHVVLLGFDGMAGTNLDTTRCMPYLKSLMEKSAWTLHKRAVLPTWSATNWAAMFMGIGPDGNGYTQWDSQGPVFTPSDKGPNGFFPTIFTQLRLARPDAESMCAFQWDGIGYVIDSAAVSKVVLFTESPESCDEMAAFAASYIVEKKPALSVLVWDYPDATGHTRGWYTKEYYEMLPRLDRNIQTIVEAIEASDIAGKTLIIVTSDHGGHDYGHGMELDSDLFSPLVIYGKGVHAGELQEPIYQYDIAATIASALRLPVPGTWRGKPVKEAF